MKRNIKRFLLVLLLLFCTLAFSFNLNVNGLDTVKTDKGDYSYTTEKETKRELLSGVDYIVNEGYTTRSGKQYDQRVSVFTADLNENNDIKVATWAILDPNGTGFIRRGLLEIAKDYEKHNPGYKVLAGINADQYYATLGTGLGTNGSMLYVPQPYYPMVTNGDNLFVATAYGFANFSNVVGLKNDGSAKPFINGTRSSKGIYVHVYDENMNEIGLFPTDGLDCELGKNKTVILASYHLDVAGTDAVITKDGANDIYVVGDAELSYVSNIKAWSNWNSNAQDAFFGKGVITEVTKKVSLNGGNKFAIETTNEELKAKLAVGTYVKVQAEFDDDFAGIEEAIGYHTIQRINGKDNNVSNSYNTRAYPRSCFGFDPDGKTYLFTCFGDNSSPTEGLFAEEVNAFCKKYNISDCWQMDGGGSVTCIARNQDGELDYAEGCIEETHKNKGDLTFAEYRYIYSGLFIVVKVPDIDVEVTEKTTYGAKLSVDTTKVNGAYEEATLRLMNSETKVFKEFPLDLKAGKTYIEAKELKQFSDYEYIIYAKKQGKEEETTYLSGKINTLRRLPLVLNVNVKKNSNGYDVEYELLDENKAMYKLFANIGGKEYECTIDKEKGIAKVILPKDINVFDVKLKAECALDITHPIKEMYDIDARCFKVPFEQALNEVPSTLKTIIGKFCK